MFKLVLEKAEEPEIKLPTSVGSLKKQESSRKTSISAMPEPLTAWITVKTVENFSRDGNTRLPHLLPDKICVQVKKKQLELDMEQQTGSK